MSPSRRGDDEPRYGDRPKPPPVGPRPALRFPLGVGRPRRSRRAPGRLGRASTRSPGSVAGAASASTRSPIPTSSTPTRTSRSSSPRTSTPPPASEPTTTTSPSTTPRPIAATLPPDEIDLTSDRHDDLFSVADADRPTTRRPGSGPGRAAALERSAHRRGARGPGRRGRRPRRLVVVRVELAPLARQRPRLGRRVGPRGVRHRRDRLAGRRDGRLASDRRRDVLLRRARRRGRGPAERLRPRPEHRVRARVVRGGRGRGARRRRSAGRRPAPRRNPVAEYASGASGYAPPASASGRDLQTAVAWGVGFAVARRWPRSCSARPSRWPWSSPSSRSAPSSSSTRSAAPGSSPPPCSATSPSCCAPLAVYWKGADAYPLLIALTVMAALGWHLVGADGDARVLESIGVTLLGDRRGSAGSARSPRSCCAAPTASASCSPR